MRKFLTAAIAFILLLVVGLFTLYIAGLAPQDAVKASIANSLEQLKAEHETPRILGTESRDRLDNFTDCWMLNLSLYLDTRENPGAVLSNPIYWESGSEPYGELTQAVGGANANGTYTNYCMGFRSWLRPLLTIMDYSQIRSLLGTLLWTLFILTIVQIQKSTQDSLFAALYAFSILALNPIAISGSLTYMSCFFIAFIGLLAVPSVLNAKKNWVSPELLFVILGFLTQYFDFYTSPLIVFGYPMILMLKIKQDHSENMSFSSALRFVGKCAAVWLASYIGTWVMKILLTNFFVGTSAATVFSQVMKGVLGSNSATQSEAYIFTFLKALYYSSLNILSPAVILVLVPACIAWLIQFIKLDHKKAHIKSNFIYLVVAGISIIWIFAARRTIDHYFFQYRTLGVALIGVFAFMSQCIKRDIPQIKG